MPMLPVECVHHSDDCRYPLWQCMTCQSVYCNKHVLTICKTVKQGPGISGMVYRSCQSCSERHAAMPVRMRQILEEKR